jgi:hypothetical protein
VKVIAAALANRSAAFKVRRGERNDQRSAVVTD